MKGKDEMSKAEEIKKKDSINRKNTIAQFECTRNCFSCPFPGSKCVGNPEFLKTIR